jgi:hypothetical protein
VAYSEQFSCDLCKAIRNPLTNNWYLAKHVENCGILITSFDSLIAKQGTHTTLCNDGCVGKYIYQNTNHSNQVNQEKEK